MKVTVNIECTPEEARQFMGLPDLTPIHEAYVDRTRVAIEQGITPDAIRSLIQTWGPMGEAGFGLWKRLLEQMSGSRPHT
jgi:hypothetical protein